MVSISKGTKRKKSKKPRPAEKMLWDFIIGFGCIVGPRGCSGRITIHHCGTGGGGRKDHSKVIPLCWEHHLGAEGIDGGRLSKRGWQEIFGSELELLNKTRSLLEK